MVVSLGTRDSALEGEKKIHMTLFYIAPFPETRAPRILYQLFHKQIIKANRSFINTETTQHLWHIQFPMIIPYATDKQEFIPDVFHFSAPRYKVVGFRARSRNTHGSLKWLKEHVTSSHPMPYISMTLNTSANYM